MNIHLIFPGIYYQMQSAKALIEFAGSKRQTLEKKEKK